MSLSALVGTRWRGRAELWLDPLGDAADWSDCELVVTTDGVSYTWSHAGKAHHGSIAVGGAESAFTDTFHSPTPLTFRPVAPTGALLNLLGSYDAGEGPPWGWRIILAHRPQFGELSEALVLQMTNIPPWGEEVRAVRMTAARI
jgi:hypothetical protein